MQNDTKTPTTPAPGCPCTDCRCGDCRCGRNHTCKCGARCG